MLLHFEIIWSMWLQKPSLSSTIVPKNFVSSEGEIATSLTKISLSKFADMERVVFKGISCFQKSVYKVFFWIQHNVLPQESSRCEYWLTGSSQTVIIAAEHNSGHKHS